MTTTFHTATTLDGFLADPDDSLDWLLRQQQGADGEREFADFMAGVGAILMGSTTYEWVVRHLDEAGGGEWPYRVPSWVMTTRDLEPLPGADVRFASGDVRAVHAQMAEVAGDRHLWVVGGGDLAGQLAEAGLLDEVVVSVAPVVLGAGRPLLPRRLDLELLDTHRAEAFVVSRYRVNGPLLEDRPAAP